jgi:hypothetical protein
MPPRHTPPAKALRPKQKQRKGQSINSAIKRPLFLLLELEVERADRRPRTVTALTLLGATFAHAEPVGTAIQSAIAAEAAKCTKGDRSAGRLCRPQWRDHYASAAEGGEQTALRLRHSSASAPRFSSGARQRLQSPGGRSARTLRSRSSRSDRGDCRRSALD